MTDAIEKYLGLIAALKQEKAYVAIFMAYTNAAEMAASATDARNMLPSILEAAVLDARELRKEADQKAVYAWAGNLAKQHGFADSLDDFMKGFVKVDENAEA